jgi:hypothetical protein
MWAARGESRGPRQAGRAGAPGGERRAGAGRGESLEAHGGA